MLCDRSQFTEEAVKRLAPVAARVWSGHIPLIPGLPTAAASDLFSSIGR